MMNNAGKISQTSVGVSPYNRLDKQKRDKAQSSLERRLYT